MTNTVRCLLLVALTGLLACSSDDSSDGTNGGTDAGGSEAGPDKSGLGDDPGTPQGTPFNLPNGLTVDGAITGSQDGGCSPTQTLPVGSGVLVRTCLQIRNSSGGTIDLTLPSGIVMVSQAAKFQHGILLESFPISVPPTVDNPPKGSQPTVIPVYTYSLNKSRQSATQEARFDLGPVTNNAGLREVMTLIQGKSLAGNETKTSIVQKAIWDVTDGNGLTEEDRTALKGL